MVMNFRREALEYGIQKQRPVNKPGMKPPGNGKDMLSDRDYMRPSATHWRPWDRRYGSVIKPLIWINVIIWLLTQAGSLGMDLQEAILLHPAYIRQAQIWRLGTYMFAHGGLTHILCNMWGLYLFGRPVEERLGPHRFLRLYFISGLVGGAAWLLANWWTTSVVQLQGATDLAEFKRQLALLNSHALRFDYEGRVVTVMGAAGALGAQGMSIIRALGGCIGASGAVFGVMMAAAMTFPNMQILLLIPPIPMKLRTMVMAYAALEVVMVWTSSRGAGSSRIAHLAHLGGLAGAFLYMKHLSHGSSGISFTRWWQEWTAHRRFERQRRTASSDTGTGHLSAEADRILDKIGREGIGSLTPDERRVLDEARNRLKDREAR